MNRSNPTWYPPSRSGVSDLYLYNSLTRKKEKFIPKSKIVTWYNCGPTTYDESHMGHARSYVTFDILRRVLQDYFGYPIMFVMNITDIDDKIIKRARAKHLFENYRKTIDESQLLEDLSHAFQLYEKRIATTDDAAKIKMLVEDVEKVRNTVNLLKIAKSSNDEEVIRGLLKQLEVDSESVLGEWLDAKKGQEIKDNSIFADLPRQYEEKFYRDMEELNVLPADIVTRVSEFVPQIVTFIKKIIDNGYAYESNGSVYFNVSRFDSHHEHYYAKVNYFLHTGHLHIDGCKMSKSLKNFITVREALKQYTPSQLRIAFLMHPWNATLDYNANGMEGAKQFLKMVNEFVLNVDDAIRRLGVSFTTWREVESDLNHSFNSARITVHELLCDNIDTKGSLETIRDLISESNKYLNCQSKINSQLLTNIKNYILKILNIFGLCLHDSVEKSQDDNKVLSLAAVISDVREKLRNLSKSKESDVESLRKSQLRICDDIRDKLLPPLGIRLEDRDKGPPSIKIVNSKDLLKEIENKKAEDELKKLKTQEATAEVAEVEDPLLMFQTGKFSAWNESGIPTHDQEGKEITKTQIKKLTKAMELQKKKYDKWKLKQESLNAT